MRRHGAAVTWWVFFACVVISRWEVVSRYNLTYVSNDEVIAWQMADDYASGDFNEPCFYGQNYNPMLEPLLAAPLIDAGVAVPLAVTIAAAFMSLFPFVLFSVVLYRKGWQLVSYFLLFIPLALPVEYDMLISMSRGFNSGIFLCGFFVFPLVAPHRKLNWAAAGLVAGTAGFFNPNSLVVAVPFIAWLWLQNLRRPLFYVTLAFSMVPGILAFIYTRRFYADHPEFNVHPGWGLCFFPSYILDSLDFLDDFFQLCTPLLWPAGWMFIPLFLTAGLTGMFRKDLHAAVPMLVAVAFVVVSLGINKVHDRMNTLLLSSARMYVGVPLLWGLAAFWCHRLYGQVPQIRGVLLTVAVVMVCVKLSVTQAVVHSHTQKTNYVAVAVKKVEALCRDCEMLKRLADNNQASLLVLVPNTFQNIPEMEFYNYGCQFLLSGFPETTLAGYERRTLVYRDMLKPYQGNAVVFGWHYRPELLTNAPEVEVLSPELCSSLLLHQPVQLNATLARLGVNYGR
jgi:hypothetical protein